MQPRGEGFHRFKGFRGYRTPPSILIVGTLEQVTHLQVKGSDNILDGTSGEALQEHLAVFAYADAKARVILIVVCGAERFGPITVERGNLESAYHILEIC